MAIEDVIAQHSVTMSDQMLQIAEYARSEREVELECFAQIKAFCTKAGVKIAGEFDRTIGSGRPDAHYQGVIIEYKDPSNPATRIGPSPNSAGTRAVVKQIKGRFPELEKELHYPLERLLGIGCDGRMLVFVRYRGGRWDEEPPQPVSSHSVERLLRALVSLGAQGKSFTPEYLSADFGSDSDIAQEGVRDLYGVITKTKSKKALMFFGQWKILFGEVCGYDVEGKNTKIENLAAHYSILNARPAELLFAVHSYYAIFMKFLAAEIAESFSPLGVSVHKKCVSAPTAGALRREMEILEQGGIWAQRGITNFLEGDLFSWYLDAWDDKVSGVVHGIVVRLDDYDPTTLSVDPAESRDLLKKLYQQLFPKSVRHDLGEYYTPDWLAEHVLDELGYDGNPDKRVLDPACGSGTFLVMAINRIKSWFDEHRHECGYGEAELVRKILSNVIGFDLNPLAVMASRTNYLMALRDLLRHATSVEIPVYLCDSVMTPAEYGDLFTGSLETALKIKTSAAEFVIPQEVATSRENMGRYADTLEFCVRNRYSSDDFLARCTEEALPIKETELHRSLFEQLRRLDTENQNGIWARIIKNAFAPLFIDRVDYVVGNPPWVNWQNLPNGYRKDTEPIWRHYHLIGASTKGRRQSSETSKTDVAYLMTYVAADLYLKPGGNLGFVITQSAFQSELGARQFRRFQLPDGVRLKVSSVTDMVRLQPFEDATNRTSVMVLNRGSTTKWPVPYPTWGRKPGERISSDLTLEEVKQRITILGWVAYPIISRDMLSSWIAGRDHAVSIVRNLVRPSAYADAVREGVNTRGANGVFYVDVLEGLPKGNLLVRNRPDQGRKKLDAETGAVEGTYVYPLLTGKDVARWIARPRFHLLLPHSQVSPTDPRPEAEMRRHSRRTYDFLHRFESFLRSRKKFRNFDPSKGTFYGLYNVGTYTFTDYKVVWREIANDFIAAPVGPAGDSDRSRPVVANHKLMVVPVQSRDEALFVSGMLNCTLARYTVLSYAVSTQISTHVLKHLDIPRFGEHDPTHLAVVEAAARAVDAASAGDSSRLRKAEKDVDLAACSIWGVKNDEFQVIQSALREVKDFLVEGEPGHNRVESEDEE